MNFKEEYTDRVEKIEKILKKYLPEKKGVPALQEHHVSAVIYGMTEEYYDAKDDCRCDGI